jgi:hypothetical protein
MRFFHSLPKSMKCDTSNEMVGWRMVELSSIFYAKRPTWGMRGVAGDKWLPKSIIFTTKPTTFG